MADLTTEERLAEAADDIPIEEFIRASNRRDRGETIPVLTAPEEPVAASEVVPPPPAEPPATTPSAAPPPVEERGARPRRHDPQAAVKAAIAKQREAERERDAERARRAELEAQLQRPAVAPARVEPPPAPAPVYDGADPRDPEPTIEQYRQFPDAQKRRDDARMEWAARRETRRLNYFYQAQQNQQRAEAVSQFRLNRLQQKFNEREQVDPGFMTRLDPDLKNLKWTVPRKDGTGQDYGSPLADLIMDSEYPVEMLQYLSENKGEFQRLTALHPAYDEQNWAGFLGLVRESAMVLGEIKARMAAARTARPSARPQIISRASPPISPPAASTSFDETDDAEDLSEGAVTRHVRRENARELKHRHLRRLR